MWDLPDGEQGFDAASTEFSPDDRLSLGQALCLGRGALGFRIQNSRVGRMADSPDTIDS